MNEIKKLYGNAGIEKDKGNCITCFLEIQTCVRSYDECPYHYPPFTVEKQLELIKWLARKGLIQINCLYYWFIYV